jgi:Outer membrane efflux protein
LHWNCNVARRVRECRFVIHGRSRVEPPEIHAFWRKRGGSPYRRPFKIMFIVELTRIPVRLQPTNQATPYRRRFGTGGGAWSTNVPILLLFRHQLAYRGGGALPSRFHSLLGHVRARMPATSSADRKRFDFLARVDIPSARGFELALIDGMQQRSRSRSCDAGGPEAAGRAAQGRGCRMNARKPESRHRASAATPIVLVLLSALFPRAATADTIEQVLAYAYQNNPQLNAQRANQRAVDENVPQALSGYRPKVAATISGGAQYTDSTATNTFLGVTTQTQTKTTQYPYTLGATATQTLYNGNQTANKTRAAEGQVLAGREALRVMEE